VTQIKICGVRTLEAAQQAADCGADSIGFIFAPASRNVDPARVVALLGSLSGRSGVRAIGVFVDETIQTLLEIVERCGLDAAQLHGDETPAYAATVRRRLPVIKAFKIDGKTGFSAAQAFDVDGYHVEPRVDGHLGGAGVALDWHKLQKQWDRRLPLHLSGGLNPQNVGDAIAIVQPVAVDVSSGVERDGQQDVARIAAFIDAVRAANARG
jgi:phosphoribosylanthranilate isomerase